MKKIVLLSALLLEIVFGKAQSASFSTEQLEDMISFAAVDPLQKIFKETAFFEQTEAIAHVARGEHASFQFVVLSSTCTILPRNPFGSALQSLKIRHRAIIPVCSALKEK